MLEALAKTCGATVTFRTKAPDDPKELAEALARVLGETQMLVLTGGVSVGDRDIVKEVLEDLGVERRFWRVAQRPGRPMYYGLYQHQQVFGLPGNPVSCFVGFMVYVWPSIRKCLRVTPHLPTVKARLGQPATKAKGFTGFLRGRLTWQDGQLVVTPFENQDSHLISSLLYSDCIFACPPEYKEVPAGTRVEAIPFPWTTLARLGYSEDQR